MTCRAAPGNRELEGRSLLRLKPAKAEHALKELQPNGKDLLVCGDPLLVLCLDDDVAQLRKTLAQEAWIWLSPTLDVPENDFAVMIKCHVEVIISRP